MLRLLIILVLSLAFSTFSVGASENAGFFQQDHAFGLSVLRLRYEHLLSETVFAGFPDSASLSFYELPSFTPERGVWMHPHGAAYLVVFAQAKVSLWDWANFGKPEETNALDLTDKINAIREAKLIEFRERELSTDIARRVESAWHRAVFGINGGGKRSGLDGVTYVFRACSEENGRASWDAWSPPAKSIADRLSAVALALGRFSEDGSVRELGMALNDLEMQLGDRNLNPAVE